MANKPLARRIEFCTAVVVPLALIVFFGCYWGGAASAVAGALVHQPLAPLAMLALRAVGYTYFLPLALCGLSPSPVFSGLVVYLVAGLVLLARRSWKRAAIVLLLPLLCTIPLSIIVLGIADGQTDDVKEAFAKVAATRSSENGLTVTDIDYRLVVFDLSGSNATIAGVVSTVATWKDASTNGVSSEYRREFKQDYAAQLVKLTSGAWQVTRLREDFHPGYEP